MQRRTVLSTLAAFAAAPSMGWSTPAPFRLRAEPVTAQILPEGDGATQMLGFNGTMPGPEIRGTAGQLLDIDVENGIDQDTAVHWHGIRLENAMDGVPGMTQAAIPPGEQMRYSFVPPDAGTFWYHSHNLSHEQVARGMMGPLIIAENTPPDVDRDITVLISDWLMEENGPLIPRFATRHAIAHAGYLGNFARAFLSDTRIAQGDRVRLRLINAATNRIFPLTLSGLSGQIVALDGIALPTPRPLNDLMLAPAQRVDVIADITGALRIDMTTRQGPYTLSETPLTGTNSTRQPTPIAPLPAHILPPPGPESAHLTLTMQGGAMGGQHGGDGIWAFNDHSNLPDDPFATILQGDTVRITLANDTSFPHGMHLHGHHFYELGPDGTFGDLRDTTLIDPRASRDILCLFDNPGKWLLHCHMLSHQFGGMKTWLEVT